MTLTKKLRNAIETETGCKVYGNLIMLPDGDLYPLPLVKGNKKIGKVWHASTLPTNKTITAYVNGEKLEMIGTCPMTCDGCYGVNGCYGYNSVKYILMRRTAFLRKYPDVYFTVARLQIIHQNIKKIRIHVTGDFIENEAMGWYKIFKEFPYLKGWTYTKCNIDGDLEMLDGLHNFNIVKSVIKGCGFNFGHIDYIMALYEKLTQDGENVYICRCGVDPDQHCDNCCGCSDHDRVLFIEHGTGYKAIEDPLYNTIKALINSQPSQAI